MQFRKPFARLPKRFCAETVAAEIAALGPSAWVPHPGKLPGNDALLLITPNGEVTNGFVGPMAPTEYLRRCRYIMEIMADLDAVWGRSRLMGLAPGAKVPPHVDVHYHWRTHIRLHIPIITTPKVLFTCDGETVHMKPGECWAFDSFRMHDVYNGGTEKRIHLVLDTVGSRELWDLIDAAQEQPLGDDELPAPMRPGVVSIANLKFEHVNPPAVMSPWEVQCHIEYALSHVAASPAKDRIAGRLDRFALGWMAAYGQFSPPERGLSSFHRLIAETRDELRRLGASMLLLSNEVPLERVLEELIFRIAAPVAQQHSAVSGALPGQSGRLIRPVA